VTTVWADERVHYPLHAEPYTRCRCSPRNAAYSRTTPPGACPGAGPTTPPAGARYSAGSATGAPRPGGPSTPNGAGGDPTGTPGSWSPPPTRRPCPTKATGTWPPNCPARRPARHPGQLQEQADLTEVVRLYGIRHWIEQGYKHVRDELGWAGVQARSATAIRRHQSLVHCAFSFCWNTWFDPPSTHHTPTSRPPTTPELGGISVDSPAERTCWPKALRAATPVSRASSMSRPVKVNRAQL
jgi:hypothetical protein